MSDLFLTQVEWDNIASSVFEIVSVLNVHTIAQLTQPHRKFYE